MASSPKRSTGLETLLDRCAVEVATLYIAYGRFLPETTFRFDWDETEGREGEDVHSRRRNIRALTIASSGPRATLESVRPWQDSRMWRWLWQASSERRGSWLTSLSSAGCGSWMHDDGCLSCVVSSWIADPEGCRNVCGVPACFCAPPSPRRLDTHLQDQGSARR